ncbi:MULTISPECIES: DUF6200 domain-containing protein [unclassified Microcoleus]|uniref:DUF6200 domain-containing protein n=1 Tax=unclassified Microcoleus TaxID=2642155 RepID=UPI002FD542C1
MQKSIIEEAEVAGTAGKLNTSSAPIIIEMEPQTDEAVEELVTEGKGLIYDSVHVALDQMKAQGTIAGAVVPVFIVIPPSVI